MRKIFGFSVSIFFAIGLISCSAQTAQKIEGTPSITPDVSPPEDSQPSQFSGKLIYIRDALLYLHDLDTGETTQFDQTGNYLQTPFAGAYLSVSPDRRYIAFNGLDPLYGCPTYNTDQPCVLTGPDGYFFVDTLSGETNLVAPYAVTNLSWAPDENRFVFANIQFDKVPYQIYLKIRTPDVGEPFTLTSGEYVDLYPSWSPDGEWIAFLRSPSPPRGQPKCESDSSIYDTCSDPALYIIHPDGSGLTQLIEHVYLLNSPYNAPAWSPDGRYVLVVTGPEAEGITLVDVDTGSVNEIQGLIPILQTPVFSPDGRSLLLPSQVTGYREIIQADLEGRVLKNVSARYSFDCCPVWSPDGRAVSYISQFTSVRRTLFITSLSDENQVEEFLEINTRFQPLWIK